MTTPRLPARWEKINENLILDGAHSAPRFEYILPKIKKLKPQTAMLAMSKNHDPQNFDVILDQFKNIIWTEFPGSIPAKELKKLHNRGEVQTDPKKALKAASGKTLVTGSLYLCGHIRELFYSGKEIVIQQTEWPKPRHSLFSSEPYSS